MAFKLFKKIPRDLILHNDRSPARLLNESTTCNLSTHIKRPPSAGRKATETLNKIESDNARQAAVNHNEVNSALLKGLQPKRLTPIIDNDITQDRGIEAIQPKVNCHQLDSLVTEAEQMYKEAQQKIAAAKIKSAAKKTQSDDVVVKVEHEFDVNKAYHRDHLQKMHKHLQPSSSKAFGERIDFHPPTNPKKVVITYPENAYVIKHPETDDDDFNTKRRYSTTTNAKALNSPAFHKPSTSRFPVKGEDATLTVVQPQEIQKRGYCTSSNEPTMFVNNIKQLKNKKHLLEAIKSGIQLNFLTRLYSTNKKKHYGVLGPEYTIMPKLCRLPKVKIDEPKREVCDTDDVCETTPRSDADLKVKPKTLPPLPVSDCPCIEEHAMKDVPLRRLKAKDVPEPEREVCITSEPCPPRADDGMKIAQKTLRKYEPKPCACIEPTFKDVPLVRLKPKEVKEPERVCPVVTLCDVPRADANLQVKKKRLPKLVAKPCGCIEPTYTDVPLKRLPKFDIPEPPKICPVADPCDPSQRADYGMKVKQKKLPHIPDSCPCVELHVPHYAPPIKRLNLKVAEPPKCQLVDEVCDPATRADRDYKVKMKELPKLPKSNCPCLEPPEMTDVPLKRLEAKPVPEPKKETCVDVEPCPPRADDGMTVKPKTLPVYEPKPCACVEPKYIDVPLVRLKPKEVKEPPRVCPVVTLCDVPRADANMQVKKKKLPKLIAKSCPCVETSYKDVKLPRLKKAHVPEPKKICPVEEVCDESARADKGYKIVQKKLPTMILCERNNEVSLREYRSQHDKSKKKTFSTCSSYCPINSNRSPYSTFSSALLPLASIVNINFEKYIATSAIAYKKSSNKEDCKPKPCPKFGKQDNCPKYNLDNCPPMARKSCKEMKAPTECTKQGSPYPAFSEVNEEHDDGRISQCQKDDYLQPHRPIFAEREPFVTPEPEVDVVDPEKEEECVYEKLNKEPCGTTTDCDNFGKAPEPVRAKDHEDAIRAMSSDSPDCKSDCSGKESSKDVVKPKICMDKPKKQKPKCADSDKKKKALRCPPPFPKKPQPKSLFQRICDFFKPRPGCPAPDDYKKEQLRKKAEIAAKRAGLVLCDPKMLEYEQAKKAKSGCVKSRPVDDCCQSKPEEAKQEPKKSSETTDSKPKCDMIQKAATTEPKAKKCAPKPPEPKPETKDRCHIGEKPTTEKKPDASSKCEAKCSEKKPTEKKEASSKCTPKSGEKPKDEGSKEEKCKKQKVACEAGDCANLSKIGEPPKTRVDCVPEDCGRKQPAAEDEEHEFAEYAIDKDKCKTFKTDCPPRSKLNCRKSKKIPKCTIPEAPYPAFSDCKVLFPKLRENECTKARRVAKQRKISYPGVGGSSGNNGNKSDADDPCKSKRYSTMAFRKSFSTMSTRHVATVFAGNSLEITRNFHSSVLPTNATVHACGWSIQNRHYSSHKNSNSEFTKLIDMLRMQAPNEEMDDNEMALRIIKAVEDGLKSLMRTNSLSTNDYAKIRTELETLSMIYRNDSHYLTGDYLISRDLLINLTPYLWRMSKNNNNSERQSGADDEENIMNICQTIAGYQENSVFNYEESERVKTEAMKNQLDELLAKLSREL